MHWWAPAVAFAAGLAAGAINAVGGGGSVLSFPALLLAGVQPVTANVTNSVALWPGTWSGAYGFRGEIRSSRWWLVGLAVPSLAGGAVGAALLLHTPPEVFKAVAPYLVLGSSVLLAVREPLARRVHLGRPGSRNRTRPSGRWLAAAVTVQLVISVYGGYFGAGMGILMLAALALLGLSDLHRGNGLKNLFSVCIKGVATLYFAFTGSVSWLLAAAMAGGAIAGGLGGAVVAHRLGQQRIRWVVVGIGVCMSLVLLLRLYL
ncbi:MAG TPA: sulfite exporter TauE/SafE family protein [Actinomycetes bacterium]|nr:sulfite exporter TauE/SafE family protein [Actinomycetes bacterium]